MEKFKFWSDIAATWITVLGVLVGGILGYLEYADKHATERVKVTLEYVSRFDSPPLRDARLKFERFWDSNAEAVFNRGEKELSDFILTSIREHGLVNDTNLIIEFFDDIHVCVVAKICDEVTAIRFFGKESYDFYGLNYPYIEEQRRHTKDQSFGCGVESFKLSYRTGKPVARFPCAANKGPV